MTVLYNYSMLMRAIHDFIALTKNNNIDLRTIKSCIDRKQHAIIALLFFNLHWTYCWRDIQIWLLLEISSP
jgi:hypothetical protein